MEKVISHEGKERVLEDGKERKKERKNGYWREEWKEMKLRYYCQNILSELTEFIGNAGRVLVLTSTFISFILSFTLPFLS